MSQVTPEFREAVLAASRPVALTASGVTRLVYDVSKIPGAERLPRALVTLLENVVRRVDDEERRVEQAAAIVSAGLAGAQGDEIEFMPARVLFQDFTGVPVFVDFAAMRDAMVERGGETRRSSTRASRARSSSTTLSLRTKPVAPAVPTPTSALRRIATPSALPS